MMTPAQQRLYDIAKAAAPRTHIKANRATVIALELKGYIRATSTSNGYWFIKVVK